MNDKSFEYLSLNAENDSEMCVWATHMAWLRAIHCSPVGTSTSKIERLWNQETYLRFTAIHKTWNSFSLIWLFFFCFVGSVFFFSVCWVVAREKPLAFFLIKFSKRQTWTNRCHTGGRVARLMLLNLWVVEKPLTLTFHYLLFLFFCLFEIHLRVAAPGCWMGCRSNK